ncbi:MAG: hypothetical protein BGN88_05045 [Clostridiales bacterium 43-6]|nr:MAG: hypothetical protein BGN88_05045 [Clostridiales bacterium 43-6]
MKRLWAVLILMVLIAAICTAGYITIEGYRDKTVTTLQAAMAAANSGDYKKAEELAKQAETTWIDAEQKLSIFVNHSQLSEVGLSVAKLAPLIKDGSVGEFNAECSLSIVQLIHISNREKFRWENFI